MNDITGVDLTFVAYDETSQEILFLNHRTAPDLPVHIAVRMTSATPMLFDPVTWSLEWGTYLGQIKTGSIVAESIANVPASRLLKSDERAMRLMGDVEVLPEGSVDIAADSYLDVLDAPSRVPVNRFSIRNISRSVYGPDSLSELQQPPLHFSRSHRAS